jgi:hypothetical protein
MPMSLDRAPLEQDTDATQHDWLAPLAMFIAWLAGLFAQIARMKRIRRTTRFGPDWRDHWPRLRQCEWIRDQVRAAGANMILNGRDIDFTDFPMSLDPPADYGGPCPRTPFEMNRRFLALARYTAHPEAAMLLLAMRIAKRERIDLDSPLRLASRSTSPGFAEGGLPLASRTESSLAVRLGRWHARSDARDGGGRPHARGPPHTSPKIRNSTSQARPVRALPRVSRSPPIAPPRKTGGGPG